MKNRSRKPPRPARALLGRLSPSHLEDSALGDYDEMYGWKADRSGRMAADLWYWRQVIHALALSLFWGGVMLRNYLKITWRHFKRHTAYSVINISGLALGIACCIFILLWIRDELSWDRFHEHADDIYMVSQRQHDGHLTPSTPFALAAHLKSEYPEVVDAARFVKYYNLQLKHGDNSFAERPVMADPAFLKIFSFRLLRGDPGTALDAGNSIVISRELASKLFGDEDPVGQTVLVNNRSDFEVTGVFEDIPPNSSLHFDLILPFEIVAGGRDTSWTESSVWTHVRLRAGTKARDFEPRIAGLVREHVPHSRAELHLQPLLSLHLQPQGEGGPIFYIYIFSAMAIFVLVIACINFVNLTTARAAGRAREVGMRKVIGARRSHLIKQFFGESLIFSFTAVVGALLLAALFLGTFNGLSGKEFAFGRDVVGNAPLVLGIVGIALVTGLLTGFYPALFLSSFQPVDVLRTAKGGGRGGGGRSPLPRRVLVGLQFSLSIFLMIGTFVIHGQLRFIRSRDLGFDTRHVIYSGSTWSLDRETIKRELLRHPDVLGVSFVSQRMGEWESSAREDAEWEGREEDLKITFEVIFCDHDFLDVHGMEMKEGRFFSREFPADEGGSFILNQEAVRQMGFGERSPLGERLSFWDKYNGTIIGVIKDFHTQPLHERIQPVIMGYRRASLDNISIRIRGENMAATLAFLEEKWRELHPGFSLEYAFLDEMLERRYRSEAATGRLLGYFTFLGIFISCIGLLGLVSYIARQRTKEIGIRRVLGASVGGILGLITREFVLLVGLANLIAWPAAYFAARGWLNNFAYRTELGAGAFVISGGLALLIAFLTVILQALKAASADPVVSLRYE